MMLNSRPGAYCRYVARKPLRFSRRRQRAAEARSAFEEQRLAASLAHERTRMLDQRFAVIDMQFGGDHDKVRLADVQAMASLADDWEENRQACVDVLCQYLRRPYPPEPPKSPDNASAARRLAFHRNREARHAVIRAISAHLRMDARRLLGRP